MSGVLRRPSGVGIVEEDGTVYVANLPRGPLVVLGGSASEVWRAAQGAHREQVAGLVADAFGVEVSVVAEPVEGLLDDLLAQGLLESS